MIPFIKKVLAFCGKYAGRIRAAFLFSFIKSVCFNAPIIIAYFMLDSYLKQTLTADTCLILAGAVAGCLILEIVCTHIANVLQAGTGYLVLADKRLELGKHLRRLPMGYFTEGNIGRISSVLATDMVFLEENGMTVLADIMSYLFSEVIMVIMLFVMNVWLGVAAVVFIAAAQIIKKLMKKSTIEDSVIQREQSENLTNSVLAFAEGIGTIKSYNLLGEKSKELTDNFDRSCKTSIDFEMHQSSWNYWLHSLYGVASGIVLLTALWLHSTGAIDTMFVAGLMLFVFGLFQPLKSYNGDAPRLTIMTSCIDRINELLDEKELPDNGTSHIPESGTAPEIEFRGVSFGYGEKEVLHDISFAEPRNAMYALVGPSGGGKSTTANLLARFWDVNNGQILVRGTDIREIPLGELMNNISMVFQEVYLFKDTIYNNIAMGRPDATKEEVVEAAKKARCYEFISGLPDGFETMVGEGGANLSGGERQRISIARCILKDAPIVILDEATANVDADNESYIQGAISELCRGKTLLVIAHRLNTIAGADRIFVISDGRIAEQGTHSELLANGGIYTRFISARSSGTGWNRRMSV